MRLLLGAATRKAVAAQRPTPSRLQGTAADAKDTAKAGWKYAFKDASDEDRCSRFVAGYVPVAAGAVQAARAATGGSEEEDLRSCGRFMSRLAKDPAGTAVPAVATFYAGWAFGPLVGFVVSQWGPKLWGIAKGVVNAIGCELGIGGCKDCRGNAKSWEVWWDGFDAISQFAMDEQAVHNLSELARTNGILVVDKLLKDCLGKESFDARAEDFANAVVQEFEASTRRAMERAAKMVDGTLKLMAPELQNCSSEACQRDAALVAMETGFNLVHAQAQYAARKHSYTIRGGKNWDDSSAKMAAESHLASERTRRQIAWSSFKNAAAAGDYDSAGVNAWREKQRAQQSGGVGGIVTLGALAGAAFLGWKFLWPALRRR